VHAQPLALATVQLRNAAPKPAMQSSKTEPNMSVPDVRFICA
jgi:hypothetical protein